MKNKNIVIFLVLAGLLILSQQKKQDLLPDYMESYDDFDTGRRYDLWDFHYHYHDNSGTSTDLWNQEITDTLVTGGNFVGRGSILLTTGGGGNTAYTEAISKKLFGTEDIKIHYTIDFIALKNYGYYAKIFYGTTQLPTSFTCVPYNNDQQCNGEGVIEIKRYNDLDLSQYVVLVDGKEVSDGFNAEPQLITLHGQIKVDYIKYQPYFSCAINYTHEVVVRDRFNSGSIVTLGTPNQPMTLTYLPTKFCPQDLGVLIFSETGVTDELGSITSNISRGGILQVPSGEYWQVDYITKYVTSMAERCGVGQAYDTTLKKCVQIAHQQLPTNTILYCEEDSQCVIPQQCYDATVVCGINNTCEYESAVCTPEQIINYILVLQTLDLEAPKIYSIGDGITEIQFRGEPTLDNIEVLGHTWEDSNPSYIDSPNCKTDTSQQYLQKDGCYETDITWGGYDFTVRNGGTVTSDDGHVKVKYIMEGKGAFNGRVYEGGTCTEYNPCEEGYCDIQRGECYRNYNYEFRRSGDWANVFVVTLTNLFNINVNNYNEKVMLNDPYALSLTITNNLLMAIPSAGYRTNIRIGLTDTSTPPQVVNGITFAKGTNQYNINLPTDNLGIINADIYPFMDVLPGQQHFQKYLSFSYYVTNEPDIIDCHNTPCVVGECQSNGLCIVTETEYRLCTSDADCEGDAVCDLNTGYCQVTDIIYEYVDNGGGTGDLDSFMPLILLFGGLLMFGMMMKGFRR